MNEWYAKDTSSKIKSVFDARMKNGLRVSASVPYSGSAIKTGFVKSQKRAVSYWGLENVTVETKVYDSADGDLHWLHIALSNVKVFLAGTYHGRCQNLQAYLDEFCFRFNRRYSGCQLFSRLVRAVAVSSVAD